MAQIMENRERMEAGMKLPWTFTSSVPVSGY